MSCRHPLSGKRGWAASPTGQGASVSPAPALLVFAAASLSDALEEADHAFSTATHIPVRASDAASSVLAKQIEAGARADVFFSADREWMDYLEQRALLRSGTRRDVLGNALVLIAPADSPVQLKIAPGFALVAALGGGRLACADPDSVPAGLYARAALTQLGVWDAVAPRSGAGGKRARCAGLRGTRGDAAGDRVSHRCGGGKARARGGCLSRGDASADRVPGGAHLGRAAAGRAIPRLSQRAERP